MARQRTGEKLLEKIFLPTTFFGWVLFLLEIIGRSTYRFIYYLLFISYWLIKSSVQLIKLIGKLTSTLSQLIAELIHNLSFCVYHPLKKFKFSKLKLKLPSVKIITLPKYKIPKVRLPAIKVPSLKPSKKALRYFFGLSVLFLLLFTFYFLILKDLPNPNKLITRDQIVSTKIYDRNERLLYTIYRNQNRSLVKLEELPEYLIQATIAIEDKDFYKHKGFSWRGIARAIRRNLFDHTLQGGSTIT